MNSTVAIVMLNACIMFWWCLPNQFLKTSNGGFYGSTKNSSSMYLYQQYFWCILCVCVCVCWWWFWLFVLGLVLFFSYLLVYNSFLLQFIFYTISHRHKNQIISLLTSFNVPESCTLSFMCNPNSHTCKIHKIHGFLLRNLCNTTNIYSACHREPRSVYEKQPDLDEMYNDNTDCIF